ncbi:MAG: cytochrome c maturation protein CcmE [Deltaproteobacteria bacterium]|jgi:cytochrome c-type biogenesis protein CcmE|nr:cytochrome c maturation protein CcmE [Deltaproteobacteria bacterium]
MANGLSKGAQISIGASLVTALLGWYAWTNLQQGMAYEYYQTLDEFMAQGASLDGKSLRVHGYVASNSIDRNLEAKQVRFSVQNDPTHSGIATGRTLDVLYLGLETPDLFKDGAEVVVEGTLQYHETETVFLADNLMAKCPSKFEAQAEGGAPVAQGGVNL